MLLMQVYFGSGPQSPLAMAEDDRSGKKQTHAAKLLLKSQINGLRGAVFSADGDEYTGEWLNNKKHGRGTQVWKKSGSIYNGQWKEGKPDGYGTYTVLVPETKEYTRKYCGQWKMGKKHGFGMYFYSNCEVYEGDWGKNQRSGWGRMYYECGDIYEGEWVNDKKEGQGIIRYTNGNWFDGAWRDGDKNGNGKFFYSDKGQIYEGIWVDGVARCGALSDFGRDEAPTPTQYPIPKLWLDNMDEILREAKTNVLVRLEEKWKAHKKQKSRWPTVTEGDRYK
ncbi:MORN repeat-containing protein 3 isoform X2 [Nelusetta ayraudi]|uniref:MORN repeat-containing protein 3 isoform X2 n=1 Tax=Nelusetta ayraudi TaxID=303726 RepID=UPI003F7187F5